MLKSRKTRETTTHEHDLGEQDNKKGDHLTTTTAQGTI
jgi:hypothetical protein